MPTKCTLTIQCHRLCFIMEMTFEANNGIQSLEVVFLPSFNTDLI